MHIPLSNIHEAAESAGLSYLGVISHKDATSALQKRVDKLSGWQDAGWAAEMGYMMRPSALFADLPAFLPEVKSVISFIVPYESHPRGYLNKAAEKLSYGQGRVARYAWGRDYHRVVKKRLKQFMKTLEESVGESIISRAFVDAVPLLERTLGEAVRQGFIGKSSMLIRPGVGTFFFITEVLIDAEIENEHKLRPYLPRGGGESCGTCDACIEKCPTKAFVANRVLDASRCISYLTIEKKGVFSLWEANALGPWLFGCDICQTVCPFNAGAKTTLALQEFLPENGVGESFSLKELLSIRTREAFLKKFAGTPFMRPGREGMLRNACAVAANLKYHDLAPVLEEISVIDESLVVTESAVMALSRMIADSD
jgi:epoxyqueuosine reductase